MGWTQGVLAVVAGVSLVGATKSARAQQAAAPAGGEAQASAASPTGAGLGAGVEQTLGGLTGGALVYDTASFHVVGIARLALTTQPADDFTRVGIGARFFYHLHVGDRSDFSLGGGIAFQRDDGTDRDEEVNLMVEAAAQIRHFLSDNVALTAALGFALVAVDDDFRVSSPVIVERGGNEEAYGFGGALASNFGVVYFFR